MSKENRRGVWTGRIQIRFKRRKWKRGLDRQNTEKFKQRASKRGTGQQKMEKFEQRESKRGSRPGQAEHEEV